MSDLKIISVTPIPSVLWPLLHYLPGEIEFEEKTWEAYLLANRYFLEALSGIPNVGSSMIWIHDYHLMVLPKMIRDKLGNDVRVGFFLHTPFPSSEVFRVLPVRLEILSGLAAADLIEFHTFDYARHFINSCVKILGASASAQGILWDGREVQIGAEPISIDPNQFLEALRDEATQAEHEKLLANLQGKTVILGIDRLDYIKGIPNKIAAYQRLLEKYPSYKEETVLIQVAVPSRDDVANYASLKHLVFELVGNLNSRISPSQIQLLYKSIGLNELVSLYEIADICLITSVRDGLNLVSHEYVVCQRSKNARHGALILSEFAGAAQSLNGAICTNPWNIDDVAEKMHLCLQMNDEERKENFEKLFEYVTSHTALNWGLAFAERLSRSRNTKDKTGAQYENAASKDSEGLLLKYDMQMMPKEDIQALLRDENRQQEDLLVLVPNNSTEFQEDVSGSIFFLIADECILRRASTGEIVKLTAESDEEWMQQALPMLTFFSDRTPGSKILMLPVNLSRRYSFLLSFYEAWSSRMDLFIRR